MKTTNKPAKAGPNGAVVRGHAVVPRVQELARKNSIKALRRLIQLIKSDSHHVAVDAAKAVLDRGEGRVPQRARQNRTRKARPQELKVKIQTLRGVASDDDRA